MDAIGDFVLWLGVAARLRELYPGERITLVTTELNAPLAKALPYWDEIVTIVPLRLARTFGYRRSVLRDLRARAFRVALHPTYSRAATTGDALVRATGALERIGFDGDTANSGTFERAMTRRWYTRLVDDGSLHINELERNAIFLAAISDGRLRPQPMSTLPAALLPPALEVAVPFFVVFPGASWSGKQWPLERFGTVLNSTACETGWTPVLCGSAGEEGLCERLAKMSRVGSINLAGKTTLPEFCELLRRAELVVSNDTSTVHIAAAVGTQSVCIVGGGHFGRFLPYADAAAATIAAPPAVVNHKMRCYGCDWKCSQPHESGGPMPCIAGVTTQQVQAQVVRLIAATETAPTGAGLPSSTPTSIRRA